MELELLEYMYMYINLFDVFSKSEIKIIDIVTGSDEVINCCTFLLLSNFPTPIFSIFHESGLACIQ